MVQIYSALDTLRRVVDGVIRWRRQKVFVGKGLNGERVGLEQIAEGLWRVWFSFYELGWLDERQGRLLPPAGPGGAGARPGREPDSGRPAGSLRPAPSPDEKCYLCAWHKVLPMSRSAQWSMYDLFHKFALDNMYCSVVGRHGGRPLQVTLVQRRPPEPS